MPLVVALMLSPAGLRWKVYGWCVSNCKLVKRVTIDFIHFVFRFVDIVYILFCRAYRVMAFVHFK
jgi:hypothetical protein